MSGPCTDCGGPDYQTLLARIAALEAENWQLEEDRLLDMDQGYYRKLEARIAELEAQLADCAKTCGGLEYRLEQAERETP